MRKNTPYQSILSKLYHASGLLNRFLYQKQLLKVTFISELTSLFSQRADIPISTRGQTSDLWSHKGLIDHSCWPSIRVRSCRWKNPSTILNTSHETCDVFVSTGSWFLTLSTKCWSTTEELVMEVQLEMRKKRYNNIF